MTDDLNPTPASSTDHLDAGAGGRMPLVSVLINCYNGARYLREAIESVYAQTYPDWEIVLWDNASTDGTPRIAQAYDSRLRYFRGEATVPLGAARNLAMAEAKGEFIAFLDSDDRWDLRKLERQIPLFDDPEVGLVYSDVISFNDSGQQRRVSSRKELLRGRCFERLLLEYGIYMSSVVLRRAALGRPELQFNERFNMVEEADLFLRLALEWKLDVVEDALAYWRVHTASGVWSEYELMASESEEMIRLLAESVPGLGERFTETLQKKRAWIARTRGLAQWRLGHGAEARSAIRASPRWTIELAALWFMTFLPATLFLPMLYRLRGAVVYPSGGEVGSGSV